MIILHSADGRDEIFVSPDDISTATWKGCDGAQIKLTDGLLHVVRESPYDIARLRAAWERRFNAPELKGELVMAVGMAREHGPQGEVGRPSIQFQCCQITADLRDRRKAERSRQRWSWLQHIDPMRLAAPL